MTSRPSIARTMIGLLNTMFSASSSLTWAGVGLPDSRSLRKEGWKHHGMEYEPPYGEDDPSLLDFKAIHYRHKRKSIATDEQLKRIENVPKREYIRRGFNQHTLEKICRREPVRAIKLAICLKLLEEWGKKSNGLPQHEVLGGIVNAQSSHQALRGSLIDNQLKRVQKECF